MREPTNAVVRAVTLPVAEPIGSSWEELNAALVNCFRLSTDAANWCVHALFRRDTPNDPKTPQTVKPRGKNSPAGFYSYGEYLSAHPGCTSKSGTWSGAAQSLNICLRYAERKYRDERFDVMVRHKSGLLSVRYPYPFPVDADAWTPSYAGGGFPTVSLTLPGHGKFTLRLKRRADFGRQLAMFKALHDGTAKKGEAALYRNGKGKGERMANKLQKLHPDEPKIQFDFEHIGNGLANLVFYTEVITPFTLEDSSVPNPEAAAANPRLRADA